MKVLGLIIGVIALVAAFLAFGAWIGMVVIGAWIAESHSTIHTPSFWETFFGLWAIGIIGSAFNGAKFSGKINK